MLLKCCTQYISKFGKFSSGCRTGKRQFSFQFQRRAMLKNVQATTQLSSFNRLVRFWSKSSKLGFSSTWTKNFPDFKTWFRKGRGTRDQIANIRWIIEKAREFQKNICFIDYAKAFDCVYDKKTVENFERDRKPDHLTCLLRNLYVGQEATITARHETTDLFQIRKGVSQSCILSPSSFNGLVEYIMWNARLNEWQAGVKITRRTISNPKGQMIPL